MHYEILDKKRLDILPCLSALKDDFYLAGGTALALQIGHRDSIDFDFFKNGDIDTQVLFDKLKDTFSKKKLVKIQEEKNTLTVLAEEDIKISFFGYRYSLINSLMEEEYIRLASVEDIAAMKMAAIISRAVNKDYIDLFFILKTHPLKKLIEIAQKKFPDIDTNLILKSLVYFQDIAMEPIIFKNNNEVDFEIVKDRLMKVVRDYVCF